ncbi:sensor histidine kinase [Salipaludibacillus agaradhaerens]|uniref:sensor histidine kinase n=1 Tax=Salipaludibacillus agaradhaerens TaxID=76935 RepID=UPI002150A38F|nr:sensor histidine kinase [Salipaludibacillus agaradhaerens]MCR6119763.1 sensor histidine kinase [Salipaludibacillus agaradhaerens]UJW58822.1 sensor histidine kinase [Bacillus sp. A116_S68]
MINRKILHLYFVNHGILVLEIIDDVACEPNNLFAKPHYDNAFLMRPSHSFLISWRGCDSHMLMFRKYRIHSIFFASFFIFTVSILIVIIFFSYHYSSTQIIDTTTEYQKNNLYRLSEELGDNLKSFQDYSVILSRQHNFRQVISGRQSVREQASGRTSLTNDFSNVIYSVQALHTVEIFMSSPPVDNIQFPVRYSELESIFEKEWFQDIEDSAYSWLSHREVDTTAGPTEVISLGRKINTSNGDLSAVMIINLDPLIVENWLRKDHEDSHIVLLDHMGAIVASTNQEEIGGNEYGGLINGSQESFFDSPSQSQRQLENNLVVTSSIPSVNWTVIQITPYEELTEGSVNMAKKLGLIGVVGVLIVLIVTFFLTKKFTYPILQLANVMKSYRLTQTKVSLPQGYRNEFGELFEGFEELTNNMEELYKSLDDQHHRQRKAEIKALQANINPHFLYNTLDQLNWMAIEKGNIDISRMLELLGKMLRIGLSKGESIITIRDELKYLEYYMNLQKIQLEDRLTYDMRVSDNVLNYYIPKLTLQPFVENAIIHGFRDRRHGVIMIDMKENAQDLILYVIDNGIGFSKPPLLTNSQQHLGGYGIKNVIERLNVYFGDKADVQIDSEEGRTTVSITIPKVSNKSHLSA